MSTRLLLDANLSPKIVRKIAEDFPDCIHVFQTTLAEDADDIDIWEFARANGLALLLTYDEDFRNLVERLGPPPKVILLRIYDQRVATEVALIRGKKAEIVAFLSDKNQEVLELRQ